MLKDLLIADKEQFLHLCKTHKVKTLYAFGSSVSGAFTDKSDIDLVVEVSEPDPINKGELLLSFWEKLELFFKRQVDLLTASSIKNPVLRQQIEKTKKLVYDGASNQILL